MNSEALKTVHLEWRGQPRGCPDPDAIPEPPLELRLESDRQSSTPDASIHREGNVRLLLNGGVLQADRLEFDSDFNSLFARGSVRYRKGAQYFRPARCDSAWCTATAPWRTSTAFSTSIQQRLTSTHSPAIRSQATPAAAIP